MGRTVEIPTELFKILLRAGEALSEFSDAFEDYLILRNPALLRRLRKSGREDLAGKTRSFESFKRSLKRLRD
jgi:hypothetical protein